jgi:predicted transcriptional regulator
LSASKIDNTSAEQAAGVLKAVARAVRLQIIQLLAERDKCIRDIAQEAGSKQAIKSRHLNTMKDKDRGVLGPDAIGRKCITE